MDHLIIHLKKYIGTRLLKIIIFIFFFFFNKITKESYTCRKNRGSRYRISRRRPRRRVTYRLILRLITVFILFVLCITPASLDAGRPVCRTRNTVSVPFSIVHYFNELVFWSLDTSR